MATGYNICPMCKNKYNLGRRSKNPQSYLKVGKEHICMKCCNNILKQIEETKK